MKQLFEFKENKTFFGLDVYTPGVKLRDIEKLPFAQFFKNSHVGSTMAYIDGENYIYLHDWERFCKSFIQHGKHRYQNQLSEIETPISIYSITQHGELRFKRTINAHNYTYSDSSGSMDIEIKHKKNGKILWLYTKEFYQMGIDEYSNNEEIMKKVYSSNYIDIDDWWKLYNNLDRQ